MLHYYHGTDRPQRVIEQLLGSGILPSNFHLTHEKEVATNYGTSTIEIVLEKDLILASVRRINKETNYNPVVGNHIETVLETPAARNELYSVLWDAMILD